MSLGARSKSGVVGLIPLHLAAVTGPIALLAIGSAWAGPPYVTDDPEQTPAGRWENYLFASGTNLPGSTAGQAGIALNYGLAQSLQLALTLPAGYASFHGRRGGAGDVSVGTKYHFLHSGGDSWLPDAALSPSMTLPTGSRAFGEGHATLFIPLWLGKTFGEWSSFGGGGYGVNPGLGQRNYALAGWALTRRLGDHINLGVEIYHQTPTVRGGVALTNLGFGMIYQITKHWAVMASGGPGLETPSRSGTSAFYFSLQFIN